MTDSQWPGSDERSVVEEMLRDRSSKHWDECSAFVKRRVYAKAKNIPNILQDDLIQEVLYKITKYLSNFHFHCALTTWLSAIIEHSIIDIYRRLQNQLSFTIPLSDTSNESEREGELLTANEVQSAEDIAITNEELQNALDALLEYTKAHSHPDRDQLIINMVILNGHTHIEAAKAAGCNPPVVGYVVREAQIYVRKKLNYRL